MLGQDLTQVMSDAGHVCACTDRETDITNIDIVRKFLREHPVEFVINCAAYTAVDNAEQDESTAFAVNATGPGNLAQITGELGIGLIHISTDYVLNGTAPNPLSEGAPLDPQSVYGKTKAKGELRVQVANPRHWIVRTAWLYGIHGKNFVKTMLRLLAERDSLNVVDDQWGSPTWTIDLAHAILRIVEKNSAPGTYHFSDEGQITWCTFAKEIQRQAIELGLLQREIPINEVTSAQYPSPVKRPEWSVLDKTLVQKTFEVEVPDWKESLQSYLQKELALRG